MSTSYVRVDTIIGERDDEGSEELPRGRILAVPLGWDIHSEAGFAREEFRVSLCQFLAPFRLPSVMKHALTSLALIVVLTSSGCGKDRNAQRLGPTDSVDAASGVPLLSRSQISQYVRRMAQDTAGNIWFGSNDDGLCRYDGRTFTYYTTKDGLAGNAVRGIVQDRHGILWVATSGGLSRYDGTTFTTYGTMDGLPHDNVWSIMVDTSGRVWVGTDGGTAIFDGRTFTRFPLPAADLARHPEAYQSSRLVNDIVQDRNGAIWLASNGSGVFRYDGSGLKRFTEADGLCNDVVQCITEDRSGAMWFGTRSGGVSRYRNGTFTSYTTKNGLGSDFVWTVMQDRDGMVWVSTLGAGVARYDGRAFVRYGNADGLANTHVQSIMQDRQGRLWFGTSGGAYRYTEDSPDGQFFVNFTKDMAGR